MRLSHLERYMSTQLVFLIGIELLEGLPELTRGNLGEFFEQFIKRLRVFKTQLVGSFSNARLAGT